MAENNKNIILSSAGTSKNFCRALWYNYYTTVCKTLSLKKNILKYYKPKKANLLRLAFGVLFKV